MINIRSPVITDYQPLTILTLLIVLPALLTTYALTVQGTKKLDLLVSIAVRLVVYVPLVASPGLIVIIPTAPPSRRHVLGEAFSKRMFAGSFKSPSRLTVRVIVA